MENVFTSKAVGVTANYSNIDGTDKKIKKTNNNLRFKETLASKQNQPQSQYQKIPSENMEAVVYRKENPPAYQADFNVLERVAAKSTPTVSNEQAYNAIYSSHKDWYDEKKIQSY